MAARAHQVPDPRRPGGRPACAGGHPRAPASPVPRWRHPGPGGDRHAPANTPGLRHLAFAVDDIEAVAGRLEARGAELVGEIVRYGNSFRLCYIRGPEGIIVELAERIG